MRAAACVAASLLAACAETGFLAQLGKRLSGSAARPLGEGSFVVGEPYRQGGTWHVPREDYAYDETGLATVVRGSPGARTANGETVDPSRLTAQHPTLQLPAIVRVTNLENNRSAVVRVNDRGPAEPGRLIGLSEGAGGVLGIRGTGPVRVRVQVLDAESRAVAAEARARTEPPEGDRIVVAAAPRTPVEAEALPPPPGAGTGRSLSKAAAPAGPAPAQRAALSSEHEPRTPTRGTARPGRLWVQAGTFVSLRSAEAMRARLASVGPVRMSEVTANGRRLYTVRLGPARNAGEADRLLAATRRAGAADARIVVD